MDINMPESLDLMNINKPENFLSIRIPAVVGGIDTTYAAAAEAGIKEGDCIVSIAGNEITSWNEITPTLENLKKEGISTFDIEVMRDSVVQLTASVDSTYTLGIFCTGNNYPVEHISYSFFKSFPAGVGYAMDALRGYVGDFKYVFTSEGSKSVGMFGSIGSLFPKAWNWHEFWLMTAFLSIVLAFMNILPIPALDGGHAVFLIYEMITGKQPSDKFMERAQIVGMLLILGLFILATYNDLMKFVF
jgi:regulator of sigma E protease